MKQKVVYQGDCAGWVIWTDTDPTSCPRIWSDNELGQMMYSELFSKTNKASEQKSPLPSGDLNDHGPCRLIYWNT